MAMATLILAANQRKRKSLDLSRKNLIECPSSIGQLTEIEEIKLTNNQLTDLPKTFAFLNKLRSLNLSGNEFNLVPLILQNLKHLQVFLAHQNKIEILTPVVLKTGFTRLKILNLNKNKLKTLPSEIGCLTNLECLSIEHNQLVELPYEFCYLEKLTDLFLGYNHLVHLPEEFGRLWRLKRLILHKNCLQELPGSLTNCTQLILLDVASNEIRIFPAEFECLPLKYFHCECNPLLQMNPVSSLQQQEVFALKEITARFIMNQMKNCFPKFWHAILMDPQGQSILSEGSQCAVCGDFLLNTWLECVKFVNTQKCFKTSSQLMPISAKICSYDCFNKNHNFYGIASCTESR